MIILACIVVAIVVYGLGPDLDGSVANDMYHVIKAKIKSKLGI